MHPEPVERLSLRALFLSFTVSLEEEEEQMEKIQDNNTVLFMNPAWAFYPDLSTRQCGRVRRAYLYLLPQDRFSRSCGNYHGHPTTSA